MLAPPFTTPTELHQALRDHGHAVLTPTSLYTLMGTTQTALDALTPSWDNLPPDNHLRDGGRYRRRRHGCFQITPEWTIIPTPHRPHWQSSDYNALHGGIERWFEPLLPELHNQPTWFVLLQTLAKICTQLHGPRQWFIEAHQFRIDTIDGIGRPTPEGAHRDGVDFVAVLLVNRVGIKGGETRVFEAHGPHGQRFTMTQPWTTLLLDDAQVIHESTPIQPTDKTGHRDTLVLTFRRDGFQTP